MPAASACTGQQADFLGIQPDASYDRVVMNPPFAGQDDIRHVMHAFSFLKPNGRLVAIMSAGVLFRANKLTTAFRDLVADNSGAIEPLPDGSFRSSGTAVNTCIVTLTAGGGYA
jgi:16S rRNA G1207 methylase RsmC